MSEPTGTDSRPLTNGREYRRAPRLFGFVGALFCAIAVALGAYAAHAADGGDSARMQTASLYLFLHGVALLALQPRLRGRGRLLATVVLAACCCSPAAWLPPRYSAGRPGWHRPAAC